MAANPSFIVPLANTVNLGATFTVIPVVALELPNLRILSLTDVQYDCHYCFHSPYVEQLAAILHGTPNLAHLALCLRCESGTLTLNGDFVQNMSTRQHANNHFMRELAFQYKHKGGQPLRLKTLRLGFGCEVDDHMDGPIAAVKPHYLQNLLDGALLEELHMDNPMHDKGEKKASRWSRFFGFPLVTPGLDEQGSFFPKLCKVTWPWSKGEILSYLRRGDQAHLRQIALRVAEPVLSDYDFQNYHTWVRHWYFDYFHYYPDASDPSFGGSCCRPSTWCRRMPTSSSLSSPGSRRCGRSRSGCRSSPATMRAAATCRRSGAA